MDRGIAMLAVVLDVYEGGKDLIPGWKLKEGAENDTLYVPTCRSLNRYDPRSSVCVVLMTPVPILSTSTFAFGIADPLGSVNTPVREP